jgi:hypothetical protein
MSTLHLRINAADSDLVLSSRIAPNRLILASYSVRLPSAHGLNGISVDLPWLNSGVKTNNISHRLYLPVSNLDHTHVSPALEMQTNDTSIPQFFHATVYQNATSSVVTGSFEINLMFSYID